MMRNDRAPWGLLVLALCLLALGCCLLWWVLAFEWGPLVRLSTGSSSDTYTSPVVPTRAAGWPKSAASEPREASSPFRCRTLLILLT